MAVTTIGSSSNGDTDVAISTSKTAPAIIESENDLEGVDMTLAGKTINDSMINSKLVVVGNQSDITYSVSDNAAIAIDLRSEAVMASPGPKGVNNSTLVESASESDILENNSLKIGGNVISVGNGNDAVYGNFKTMHVVTEDNLASATNLGDMKLTYTVNGTGPAASGVSAFLKPVGDTYAVGTTATANAFNLSNSFSFGSNKISFGSGSDVIYGNGASIDMEASTMASAQQCGSNALMLTLNNAPNDATMHVGDDANAVAAVDSNLIELGSLGSGSSSSVYSGNAMGGGNTSTRVSSNCGVQDCIIGNVGSLAVSASAAAFDLHKGDNSAVVGIVAAQDSGTSVDSLRVGDKSSSEVTVSNQLIGFFPPRDATFSLGNSIGVFNETTMIMGNFSDFSLSACSVDSLYHWGNNAGTMSGNNGSSSSSGNISTFVSGGGGNTEPFLAGDQTSSESHIGLNYLRLDSNRVQVDDTGITNAQNLIYGNMATLEEDSNASAFLSHKGSNTLDISGLIFSPPASSGASLFSASSVSSVSTGPVGAAHDASSATAEILADSYYFTSERISVAQNNGGSVIYGNMGTFNMEADSQSILLHAGSNLVISSPSSSSLSLMAAAAVGGGGTGGGDISDISTAKSLIELNQVAFDANTISVSGGNNLIYGNMDALNVIANSYSALWHSGQMMNSGASVSLAATSNSPDISSATAEIDNNVITFGDNTISAGNGNNIIFGNLATLNFQAHAVAMMGGVAQSDSAGNLSFAGNQGMSVASSNNGAAVADISYNLIILGDTHISVGSGTNTIVSNVLDYGFMSHGVTSSYTDGYGDSGTFHVVITDASNNVLQFGNSTVDLTPTGAGKDKLDFTLFQTTDAKNGMEGEVTVTGFNVLKDTLAFGDVLDSNHNGTVNLQDLMSQVAVTHSGNDTVLGFSGGGKITLAGVNNVASLTSLNVAVSDHIIPALPTPEVHH